MHCGWERRTHHAEQRPHHVCWSPSKLGLLSHPATRCWAMLGTWNKNCDFGNIRPPPLSDLPQNRCCQDPRHQGENIMFGSCLSTAMCRRSIYSTAPSFCQYHHVIVLPLVIFTSATVHDIQRSC